MAKKTNSYSMILIVVAFSAVLTTGCYYKESSNKGSAVDNIATVPSSACLDGKSGCIYSVNYNNFANYPKDSTGQYPGYHNGYKNGFCGCAIGYSVAYNNQFGLTCVNNQQLTGSSSYISYPWNPAQFAFTMPQPRAYQAIPIQYQGSCRMDVLQACLVEVEDSCGEKNYCRALGGGALGICIYHTYTGS